MKKEDKNIIILILIVIAFFCFFNAKKSDSGTGGGTGTSGTGGGTGEIRVVAETELKKQEIGLQKETAFERLVNLYKKCRAEAGTKSNGDPEDYRLPLYGEIDVDMYNEALRILDEDFEDNTPPDEKQNFLWIQFCGYVYDIYRDKYKA